MFLQILLNTLITAASICLVSVGFGIIYFTLRFFHFAHGSVITVAAYVLYSLLAFSVFSWPLALLIALIACIVVGMAMDVLVYQRLRAHRASHSVSLLASLGMLLVLQNAISLVFGDVPVVVPLLRNSRIFELFGARITELQTISIVVSVATVGVTTVWWSRSKTGKTLRALAQDPELAVACGVRLERATAIAMGLGSALGGLGAILLGLDTSISPTIGFHLLLVSVVVVLISGRGKLLGVAVVSVLVAFIQHLVAWKLSTQWQSPLVFLILLGLLLCRPNGFLRRTAPI